MSTSPKTPRRSNDRVGTRRLGAALGVSLGVSLSAGLLAMPPASAAPALHCSVQLPATAPAGAPLMLHMTLRNTGQQPVQVLTWNTPFEGAWFGASVQLWHQGREVPYQGPSVKRGAPSAADYLEIAPGGHREAHLDLGLVFDLSQAGSYELRPQFRLHDVQSGARRAAPRPPQVALPLDCPTLQFKLSKKR